MKLFFILIVLIFAESSSWAGEATPAAASVKQAPPSTVFMSLQEVRKAQAHEQAKQAEIKSSRRSGLPPAPPPLPEHEASWTEKLVSGMIKGAAHNESLTNPDRDLRPKPEPVSPHWRGTDEK